MSVNNFDVLKRMGELNKDVRLCTTVTDVDYSAKKGGTKVSIGVPGNVCFDIVDGKLTAMLLLFNPKEFAEVKEAMHKEEK